MADYIETDSRAIRQDADETFFYRRASKSFVLACGHSGSIETWDDVRIRCYDWFRDILLEGMNRGKLFLDEIPSGLREGFCYLMISADAFSQYQKHRRQRFFDFLGEPGAFPVVIFGCGNHGSAAYRFMRRNGCQPDAFMDNNTSLWGSQIDGVPVVTPDEIRLRDPETRYVIANELYADAIEKQIMEMAGTAEAMVYRFTPEIT